MDEIIEKVAENVAAKYATNDVEKEAFYTVIREKLFKKIGNWQKKSSLDTYLTTIAYRALLDFKSEKKSLFTSDYIDNINTAGLFFMDSNYDNVDNADYSSVLLDELKNNTNSIEYEVVCKTFGLNGYVPYTRKELETELFITPGEQRTIVDNVLSRLARNKNIKELYNDL